MRDHLIIPSHQLFYWKQVLWFSHKYFTKRKNTKISLPRYFKSIEYSKIIPPFFCSMTLESSIFFTKILKAIADIHKNAILLSFFIHCKMGFCFYTTFFYLYCIFKKLLTIKTGEFVCNVNSSAFFLFLIGLLLVCK